MARSERMPAPDVSDDVERDETHRLIASNKVEGTRVYNHEGDDLGSVYNFMVDKVTGQVAYAVVAFGGFLGLGERFYPLPWSQLTYDTDKGGYLVNLDRARLENAPSYTAAESPWDDPEYGRSIYGFYGAPWYLPRGA